MIKLPKTQRKASLSTVAVVALVGGLAGTVVGMMFAPKSGKALRQGIQAKADNVRERVEDITTQHTGSLKQQGSDLVDKGKQLAEDLQTFIQETLKIKKSDDTPIEIAKNTQPATTILAQPQAQDQDQTQSESESGNEAAAIPLQPDVPSEEENK